MTKIPQKLDSKLEAFQKKSVYFSIDEKYSRYCAVTIFSILSNTKLPSSFFFTILSQSLSALSKQNLESVCDYFDANIEFVEIDTKIFHGFRASQQYFNAIKYARLLGPNFIESKKTIYLDCDLVITGDLSELFDENLQGYTLGATLNLYFPYQEIFKQKFGLPEQGCYFNSGVLLIDVEQWRNNQLSEYILEFIESNKKRFHYNDQDALNAFFWNKYHQISVEWNVESRIFSIIYPKEIRSELIHAKKIIHYTGPKKPWSSEEHVPLREYYIKYSQRLGEMFDWKPSYPEPRTASFKSQIKHQISNTRFLLGKVKKACLDLAPNRT